MEIEGHKWFGKTLGDIRINDVYAELHRCEAMEKRYWTRLEEAYNKSDFRKYVHYKMARVRCEEIIERLKKIHRGKPWEEAKDGETWQGTAGR